MTWIQTFTGRKFYPLAPRPEDIVIEDIAQSLANTCRYSGHTTCFYSVAQHSVLVARQASAEDALCALLHDAVEAYSPFGDIARPSRIALEGEYPDVAEAVGAIEARIERAIAVRFDLPYPYKSKAIGILDTRILHDERKHVMTPTADEWDVPYGPFGIEIKPWSPEEAYERFLEDFAIYLAWDRKLNQGAA